MKRFVFFAFAIATLLVAGSCNEDEETYAVRYSLEYSGDADLDLLTYKEPDGTLVEVTNPENGFEVEFEVSPGFQASLVARGFIKNGEAIILMRVRTPAQEYSLQDRVGLIGTTIPFELNLDETIQ